MELFIPLAIIAVVAVVFIFGLGKKKNTTQQEAPPPPVYKVSLFSGDAVVGEFETTRYTTGDGRLWLVQNGHDEYTLISGTYVLERINGEAVDQDVADARRYKVTLYCDGKELRTWLTTRYTTGEGRLWIVPLGMNDWTIISGTYKLVPVDSPEEVAGIRKTE